MTILERINNQRHVCIRDLHNVLYLHVKKEFDGIVSRKVYACVKTEVVKRIAAVKLGSSAQYQAARIT